MTAFLAKRLIWLIVTLFVVITFVFVAIRATGDPTLAYLPIGFTPEQHAAMEKELGVDQPVVEQYGQYLGRAVRGDFGQSNMYHVNAVHLTLTKLAATAKLAVIAFLFALVVAVPLGVVAGTRPGSRIDFGVRLLATTGQAAPSFVIALILVWAVAVKVHWLPVSGNEGWKSYVLPVLSMSWYSIAAQARITRSAVISVSHEDYIRTANAKGLSAFTVTTRHMLRNALVPIVTMMGLTWPVFLGGTVIIEVIFAWPGIGQLLLQAATNRDYAVVETVTVVFAAIFIATNIVTDAALILIDPRIRPQ